MGLQALSVRANMWQHHEVWEVLHQMDRHYSALNCLSLHIHPASQKFSL